MLKYKTIWIDLDNSPHVPFFKPIIGKLKQKGFSIVLTARDCAQTCGLADRNNFQYERIGRHFGKSKLLKVFGLLIRALQLFPFAIKTKPVLALSHGSRSQVLSASVLGIPSAVIMDYEFANQLVKPTWLIHPEIIPDKNFKFDSRRIFNYPGIKEDVYVPSFLPDYSILGNLGLNGKELVITIRPPATEAHYHNADSEVLFDAVIDRFGGMNDVQMILLPRNKAQEIGIRRKWAEQVSKGRIIIPEHVIDGLNLMWYSDIVISGGGTMNREAAALGVPVYSIFRGKIGAVDKYLVEHGKLVLLESVKDVREKITLVKRAPSNEIGTEQNNTLNSIVDTLISLVNTSQKKTC